MNKKLLFRLLASVVVATASLTQAQRPVKIPRIAFLVPSTPAGYASRIEAVKII